MFLLKLIAFIYDIFSFTKLRKVVVDALDDDRYTSRDVIIGTVKCINVEQHEQNVTKDPSGAHPEVDSGQASAAKSCPRICPKGPG
jgi:hypothetical protein